MATFETSAPRSRPVVRARGPLAVSRRKPASIAKPMPATEPPETYDRDGGLILCRIGPDGKTMHSLVINDEEFPELLGRMCCAMNDGSVAPIRWTRDAIAHQLRSLAWEFESKE